MFLFTEGGAKMFGIFCVKNHDFTPKNLIFSNCGGRSENCWDISCEKSRFYAKKTYFFQFQGGARLVHPPGTIKCMEFLHLKKKKILNQFLGENFVLANVQGLDWSMFPLPLGLVVVICLKN
jgi:hypothetical protein